VDLLGRLLSWFRPASPDEEQEEADIIDFDHETDKVSALGAPRGLEGQKFWEP